MKRTLRLTLTLVALAVFLYSGMQVYTIQKGYAKAEAQYTALEQYVTVTPVEPEKPVSPAPVPEQTEPAEPTEPIGPQVDFAALSAINPDVAAWLTIDGTGIHYPVVQGTDNKYYLKHAFDGSYNSSGSLFLDAGNDPGLTDPNTIIYGHHMKNGIMFSELLGYEAQDFYDAHPTGWLITPDGAYSIRFFSGYVTDTDASAWKLDFADGEYAPWLEEITAKSSFTSNVTPTTEDKVLTLSTCSYAFDDARFVLHGVMEMQNAE